MEAAERTAEARESAGEKFKDRAALTISALMATPLVLRGYFPLPPDLF
jgi:hypothetical protein